MIHAVITASGIAERFGGLHKELLPDATGVSFLARNICQVLCVCERATLVTNPDKVLAHTQMLVRHGFVDKVKLAVRPLDGGELLHAIQLGQDVNCRNILILGDTYFNSKFEIPDTKFGFGLFSTETPDRFSTIDEIAQRIYTKKIPTGPKPYKAWGSVYWDADLAKVIAAKPNKHWPIDYVWQQFVNEYGWGRFNITDYYDIGTIERYTEFLKVGIK